MAEQWDEAQYERVYEKQQTEANIPPSLATPASHEDVRSSLVGLSLKHDLPPIEENQDRKRSYAATLMTTTPREGLGPALANSGAANAPGPPGVHSGIKRLSSHYKDVHGILSQEPDVGIPAVSRDSSSLELLDGPISIGHRGEPYVRYQMLHMQELQDTHRGQSDGYRDTSLRCHLPLPVCVRVLSHAMNPHDLSILRGEQRQTAFAWGQKKETLKSELEWRRKDESSQILMVLAAAECVDC